MGVQWTWVRTGMLLAAAAVLVVSAACSEGEEGGDAAASSGGTPETAITVVATDNKFDKTALTIPANQEVTVTLQNKGQAIHDFKVLNVKSKDGKDISTQLITGGSTEEIEFTIDKAGTYDFNCSVHPVEMKGKLTVQ